MNHITHLIKEYGERGWLRRMYWSYKHYGYGQQLRELLKLVWPITLASVSEQLVHTTTAMFTGHLGKNQLDAMALGNTAVNVTGFSLAIGVNTACDTLFSQTYGSKNRKYLGLLLQKALVINIFISIPCAALFLNIEYILTVTGQDPIIARMAGNFTSFNIPGLVFNALMMVLCKYLASQHIVTPTTLIMIVMNVLHVFFLQLLLYWFRLDVAGAAIAMNLTYFSGLAMHVIYIYAFRVYKETWTGWSWTCLMEWREFVRLGVYGLLMTCLSWWAMEVTMVLTGLLGKVELGSHYVAVQSSSLFEMADNGVSSAINVRVGNLIGCGDHVTAKVAARVGMLFAVAWAITSSSICLAVGHVMPHVFTNDKDVVSMVESLVPFMALYLFGTVTRASVGAILRGVGRQRFGAILAFLAVYLMSLPLSVFCMFATPLRLYGTWIGLCVSELLRGVAYFVRVLRIDWKTEAELAESRTSYNLKRISNKSSAEYVEVAQEDSSDNEFDVTDPAYKTLERGGHVPQTLRSAIITRVLTLCGLLVVLTLGVVSHVLNHYDAVSLPHSNTTKPLPV